MRQTKFLSAIGLLLVLSLMTSVSQAAEKQRIGRASGSLGNATIDGQKMGIGAPVFNGSRIVTGPTDAASVLLNSNVVIKFDSNSSAIVSEINGTHIQLINGNVEVFMAKRAPGQGAVALSDPDANIEALGTVFIASYTPATRDGWYGTLESTNPQGISVKGTQDPAAASVVAGKHATLHAGKLTGIANNDPVSLKNHTGKIADLDHVLDHQAGTFLRQQTAMAAAGKLVATNGLRISNNVATALAAQGQTLATSDSINNSTINGLVTSGAITTTGGSSGGGGGPSSGGFSDVSVTLDTGDILRFRLADTGIQDGDQVSVKVSDNGSTVASIPLVTLTNSGQVFTEKVSPGTVNVSFTALNEGAIPPNTGGVTILSTVSTGHPSQSYGLNTGQTATLRMKVK
jgi:hypothetical protein